MSDRPQRVLTARRVASLLRMRRDVVLGLCRLGAFPHAYRTGRWWRIPELDVAAWQARQVGVRASG